MARTPTAYWDYIRVEELLSLQSGLEPDASKLANDEVMFITIHQIDELWMRLVLRELVAARDLFVKVPVPEQALASAVRGIDRMSQILGLIANHFALMETMTTRDYLAFRDKLNPASGFQSAQLRQIEILAGLPEGMRIPLGHEKSYMAMLKNQDGSATSASRRVDAALADTPTLVDAISNWLHRTPIQGSMPGHPEDDARVRAFIDSYCAAHAGSARAALALAKEATRNPADADRLDERFQREIDGARDFLLATDVAEADRARAVAGARRAGVHRELPRAAALGLAARGDRQPGRVRAGVRDLPPAPRAHGRADHRPPHRHRRLGRRRVPRQHRAALPHLPRRLGGADVAGAGVGVAAARAPRGLRVRQEPVSACLPSPICACAWSLRCVSSVSVAAPRACSSRS
jgi:tryptophan 2,3-dioxygenase